MMFFFNFVGFLSWAVVGASMPFSSILPLCHPHIPNLRPSSSRTFLIAMIPKILYILKTFLIQHHQIHMGHCLVVLDFFVVGTSGVDQFLDISL